MLCNTTILLSAKEQTHLKETLHDLMHQSQGSFFKILGICRWTRNILSIKIMENRLISTKHPFKLSYPKSLFRILFERLTLLWFWPFKYFWERIQNTPQHKLNSYVMGQKSLIYTLNEAKTIETNLLFNEKGKNCRVIYVLSLVLGLCREPETRFRLSSYLFLSYGKPRTYLQE